MLLFDSMLYLLLLLTIPVLVPLVTWPDNLPFAIFVVVSLASAMRLIRVFSAIPLVSRTWLTLLFVCLMMTLFVATVNMLPFGLFASWLTFVLLPSALVFSLFVRSLVLWPFVTSPVVVPF